MGDWYAVEPTQPPFRTRVTVQWAGRIFAATRIMHPKKRKPAWATFKNGEVEFLPPAGRSRIWGPEPELWQPLDPAAWTHPLPAPIPLARPAWPLPQLTASVSDGARDPLWWRDATRLTYSPAGEISVSEAEGRLMRALNTDIALRVDKPSFKTNADVLARLSATRFVADDEEPVTLDWKVPFEPAGTDLDDFLIAMRWYMALNPVELWPKSRTLGARNRLQKVLLYRAMDPPASWGFIAGRWGVSVERVRQVYASALDKLHKAANGRQVYSHVRTRDPILAVRERNKRHATQST
jgi:hypothetical protein